LIDWEEYKSISGRLLKNVRKRLYVCYSLNENKLPGWLIEKVTFDGNLLLAMLTAI